MVRDVLFNGLNQFRHAPEYASADPFGGQFAEEAFDQIEPRTARGRAMHVEPRMPLEPPLHRGVLVGRIIVDDEMQGLVLGCLVINHPKEFQPLRVAMAREARGDDFPFRDIQCGKQGGGAMPLIVMRHGPTAALLQREPRLRAIKGLNVTLLIDTEDEGMRWGIQVQPHHVVEFLQEVRVLAECERPHQVRCEPMGFPDAMDQGRVGAEVLGQRAERPVGRGARRGLRGGLHNASGQGLPGLRRTPPARSVLDNARQSVGREALPPQTHRLATGAHGGGNVPIFLPVSGQQHNRGPEHQASGRPPASGPLL